MFEGYNILSIQQFKNVFIHFYLAMLEYLSILISRKKLCYSQSFYSAIKKTF